MNKLLPFKQNLNSTVGIELELQLIDLQHFNLAMEAQDFLRRLAECKHVGEIKPEITQSMIEFNSSVHTSYTLLLEELKSIRNFLCEQAQQTHIGICGSGAHPFQKWASQRIFPTDRFEYVSEEYGYLAKQFTVFGQHIHIGCKDGDEALYLCHALARYVPHFIALSAASPFHQGVDTSFDCSRLTIVSAFPLSGTPPWLLTWAEFEEYFEKMVKLGIIKSMKDFYWDIRPKPEFGTVELRICDTPLTIEKAGALAAYAQLLSIWLLENRQQLSRDIYLTYLNNRFHAARHGLKAIFIDPIQQTRFSLSSDILQTCEQLHPIAKKLGCEQAIMYLKQSALSQENDATWLRKKFAEFKSLSDTVRAQTSLWNKNTY